MGPSLPSAGLVRPDASRFGKDETAGPRKPRSLGAPSPVGASCFQADELISLRDGSPFPSPLSLNEQKPRSDPTQTGRGFLMRDWREPRSTLQPGLHVFRYAGLLELNPPDPMQIG